MFDVQHSQIPIFYLNINGLLLMPTIAAQHQQANTTIRTCKIPLGRLTRSRLSTCSYHRIGLDGALQMALAVIGQYVVGG